MLPPMKRPLNSSRSILNKRAILCRRSEEHTSELQSRLHLVCRLLLEKKKTKFHEKEVAVRQGLESELRLDRDATALLGNTLYPYDVVRCSAPHQRLIRPDR